MAVQVRPTALKGFEKSKPFFLIPEHTLAKANANRINPIRCFVEYGFLLNYTQMRFFSFIKIFTVLLFAVSLINAKAIPPRPLGSYVYDENRMLSREQTHAFNAIAEELYQKTGVGIAAALFQSIDGEEPRDFAVRIAEAWKIGSKDKDGILIFVALDERRRSVETGYHVEAILPDALVERIQQSTLVPLFRQGRYAEGILSLELNLAKPVAKAYNKELDFKGNNTYREEKKNLSPLHFVLILLLLAFLLGTPIGRQILIYALLSGMFRGGGSHRGGRGGFGGGFGGGSFGGGGSGGSW